MHEYGFTPQGVLNLGKLVVSPCRVYCCFLTKVVNGFVQIVFSLQCWISSYSERYPVRSQVQSLTYYVSFKRG